MPTKAKAGWNSAPAVYRKILHERRSQLHKPKLRLLNAAPAAFLGLWILRQLIGIASAAAEAQRQKEEAKRVFEGLLGSRGRAGANPVDDSLFDSLGDLPGQMLWEQVNFGLGLWVVFIASAVLLVQVFKRPALR